MPQTLLIDHLGEGVVSNQIRVLFVCLGNICRSPLAEGVFRHKVKARGLQEYFRVESAGTGGWHVGEPPDRRMCETAAERGVSITAQRAQQFEALHLERFDHVFAMDKSNLHDILSHDHDDELGGKVRLFREFDPDPGDYQVPDPYYGGPEGFHEVFDIVDRTSDQLLYLLQKEYGLKLET